MVRRRTPTNKEVHENELAATVIGGAVWSGSAIHCNPDFKRHTSDLVFHLAKPDCFHLDIYTTNPVLLAHGFKKLRKAARRKRKVFETVESRWRMVSQAKEPISGPQDPPIFQVPQL